MLHGLLTHSMGFLGGLPATQAAVFKVGAKLGIDLTELLRMINGKVVPTKQVIAGLARELDSDVRYLEKLADEIRNDLK